MNKTQLISYFEKLDDALKKKALLVIYGSAVSILLDEPGRTSLDLDVAGPYSEVDFGDFKRAAEKVGIPVNPGYDFQKDHVEWISPLRLCLSRPQANSELRLWSGSKLTVKTVSIPDLIASKLVRYDSIDQGDIHYLLSQSSVDFSSIEKAVKRLPSPFKADSVVLDNLQCLKTDMLLWKVSGDD